ncbi:MAG: NAD-dependent deacylase [Candidatus Omnitrophica bacterium]|nr:NAD-dependent deacylase [Candidatus Omnitrophota bacterium]
MNIHSDDISRIAGLLKDCRSVLFITGAGISADSGLPTYRGIGGLYNDKMTEDGMPVETALSGEMLRSQPKITWKYLLEIEKNCRKARFNRAHEVIAQMEDEFERVWVFTQNIDGFHRAAGSRKVIDIHGDMHKLVCMKCGWRKETASYRWMKIPPKCPKCGSLVRPEVVLFGEMLPEDKLTILERQLIQGFDIYFSVGTSSVFSYISQPMLAAKHLGKPTIEINPEETGISGIVDIRLRMSAAEAMDAIWKEIKK